MTLHTSSLPPPASTGTDDILRLLEGFSAAAQLPFDRGLAARGLSEAERAFPGDEATAWARRLAEVGESFDLRVQLLNCTLEDALALARQGVPVATAIDRSDGPPRWLLVQEVRGRRVRLNELGADSADHWSSIKRLQQRLDTGSAAGARPWVLGQPALACDHAADAPHGHGASPGITPFSRLWSLLAPERNDLWVILVFSMIDGMLLLATPIAVEALVDTVAFGRYLQPIIVLATLLFTFLAFAAALRGLLSYVVEILQRRLFVRLVSDLAYRLPRVGRAAWDDAYAPELVNRYFEIAAVQKVASSLLLDAVTIVLRTFVGMVVLAFYHPFLLGFDLVLLTLITLITFGLGRGGVKTAVKESKAKYAMAHWLEELVRHPTAFTLQSGRQFALDRADRLAIDYLDARKKHYRIVLRQLLFALGLQALAATALLGLGGWLVIQGQLTLGQLVAAELIVTVIVGSFAKMGKHLENFYDLLASVDKLGHLLDLPVEGHHRLFHAGAEGPAAVVVRQVSYGYGGHDGRHGGALPEVSFEVRPGERIALIGPAGSGKSTLIDLLSGVREPAEGHVELDGVDLRELRGDSLHEQLGVTRGVEIFHGTIAENVHLNRAHLNARDVRQALDAVALLDEVLRLPDGLNTVLQTGGAPLSSSQALRLMLARAIVGRPRLLLIDGTFDGLPDRSLPQLLANLLGEGRACTVLVATGRQTVIDHCDRMVDLRPDSARNGERPEGGDTMIKGGDS